MLMKLVAAFGVLVLAVTLLAQDSRGPGTVSAWDDMTSTLETGVQFPVFIDPYAEGTLTLELVPNGNGTVIARKSIATVGCDIGSYFECVTADDGADSYIHMVEPTGSPDLSRFQVALNDPPAGSRFLTGLQVNIECRGDPDRRILIGLDATPGGPSISMNVNPAYCADTSTFNRLDFFQGNDNNFFNWGNVSDLEISVFAFDEEDTGGAVDVTFVSATIFFSTEFTGCEAPDGAWFPWLDETACAIGQTGAAIWKGIQFFLNGAAFVLVSIGAIFGFVFAVVGGFLGGMMGVGSFFLNLPDTPAPVQAFFTFVFVAIIGGILFVIVKVVRGTGPI